MSKLLDILEKNNTQMPNVSPSIKNTNGNICAIPVNNNATVSKKAKRKNKRKSKKSSSSSSSSSSSKSHKKKGCG